MSECLLMCGTASSVANSPARLSALLFVGSNILLFRTIALLNSGAHRVLQPWVVALTYLEMAVDVVTAMGAARWWLSGSEAHAHLPLRAGAAVTFLHAFRVLVFVVGRTGPWANFDVRPAERPKHRERWTWAQVVFAGSMAVLGIAGVFVIRAIRANSRMLSQG